MALTQDIEAILNFMIQVLVIFPYSALTIPRQRQLPSTHSNNRITPTQGAKSGAMISDKVYKLCTNNESVSALLAKDPTMAPGDAWKKLYGGHAAGEKESKATARAHRDQSTPDNLKRALECGNWGPSQPSDLFLQASTSSCKSLSRANICRCITMPCAPWIRACLDVWSARH
jgi:hypothetical protein